MVRSGSRPVRIAWKAHERIGAGSGFPGTCGPSGVETARSRQLTPVNPARGKAQGRIGPAAFGRGHGLPGGFKTQEPARRQPRIVRQPRLRKKQIRLRRRSLDQKTFEAGCMQVTAGGLSPAETQVQPVGQDQHCEGLNPMSVADARPRVADIRKARCASTSGSGTSSAWNGDA